MDRLDVHARKATTERWMNERENFRQIYFSEFLLVITVRWTFFQIEFISIGIDFVCPRYHHWKRNCVDLNKGIASNKRKNIEGEEQKHDKKEI